MGFYSKLSDMQTDTVGCTIFDSLYSAYDVDDHHLTTIVPREIINLYTPVDYQSIVTAVMVIKTLGMYYLIFIVTIGILVK